MHADRPEDGNHTNDAIYDLKISATETQLRSLTSLYNDFCRLVPNFARITSPMKVRLRGSQAKARRKLVGEALTALQTLQKDVVSAAVLVFLRNAGHYILDTDA